MAHSKNEPKNAKFYISKEDWKKVIAYAESAYHQFKSEIGGQLVVVEDEDGDFILKDPVILKQEISSGNCEMEEEALAIHYSKMVGKYGDKIRHCWWHSHHTMGAFWSGTDDNTILENETQDFSVSLVVNLKQEYKLRVQFFYPFEHEENVTLNFLENADETRDEKLDKEVEKLCTKSNVVTTYTHGYTNGKPIVNNGTQTGLWNEKDQKEIDEYNYGFGHGYSNSGPGSLGHESDVDLSGIPDDKVKSVTDLVEECQDRVIEGNCTYEQFLEIRKTINKSIEKYNLKVKLFDKKELEMNIFHMWPEQLLENINGGTNLAN